jgi:hypothetical protein
MMATAQAENAHQGVGEPVEGARGAHAAEVVDDQIRNAERSEEEVLAHGGTRHGAGVDAEAGRVGGTGGDWGFIAVEAEDHHGLRGDGGRVEDEAVDGAQAGEELVLGLGDGAGIEQGVNDHGEVAVGESEPGETLAAGECAFVGPDGVDGGVHLEAGGVGDALAQQRGAGVETFVDMDGQVDLTLGRVEVAEAEAAFVAGVVVLGLGQVDGAGLDEPGVDGRAGEVFEAGGHGEAVAVGAVQGVGAGDAEQGSAVGGVDMGHEDAGRGLGPDGGALSAGE